MEELPDHTSVFFTPIYLTRMVAQNGQVSEDKEGGAEGSRLTEDLASQVEELKCEDGKKQEMEQLPSFFCP